MLYEVITIGFLIGLPIAYPILRYLMKPMYAPLDNHWLKIGNVGKIKQEDIGVQFKYKKRVKEAYMPEADVEKNVWILKATPAVLEKVYEGAVGVSAPAAVALRFPHGRQHPDELLVRGTRQPGRVLRAAGRVGRLHP